MSNLIRKLLVFFVVSCACFHSVSWAATININQTWRDSTDGVVATSTGFAEGDTAKFTGGFWARNYGMIINIDSLYIIGDNYTILIDSLTLNTIENHSLETPDTDTTRADGWDFTLADSVWRQAGEYDRRSDAPGVWDGDYALRVHVPCANQTVISDSLYVFAADGHHCIEAVYFNGEDNNIKVTIGLLTAGGDTAYSAQNNFGISARGGTPVFVHFMTGGSTESYKIFFVISGASGVSAGNEVYIDDILHTSFHSFGIGVACDTSEANIDEMYAQRYWTGFVMDSDTGWLPGGADASDREFWGLPVAASSGERVWIDNVNIVSAQPSFNCWGIFARAKIDTITNCDITLLGSNVHGIFSWYPREHLIKDCTIELSPDYHVSKREGYPTAGINWRGDKSNYGYNSRITGCTIKNSMSCGIVVRTKRDVTQNGSIDYEQILVDTNTIYCQTFIPNGFAIEDAGEAPCIIRGNTIVADTGEFHGTGIHLQGKVTDPDSLTWSIIDGNNVRIRSYPFAQEYSYGIIGYGIQIEGVPRCSVVNNYITAVADNAFDAEEQTPVYTEALRINFGSRDRLVVKGNVLRAFYLSGDVSAECLHFGSENEWSYLEGEELYDIDSNDFISNSLWIKSLVDIAGMQFCDNYFEINDTVATPAWLKAKCSRLGDYYGAANNVQFIDNRYASDSAKALFENYPLLYDWSSSYNTRPAENAEWFIGWTTTIDVDTSGGGAYESAKVIVTDSVGSVVFHDTTDATGLFTPVIWAFRDSAEANPYDQSRDRDDYNRYTFIASALDGSTADTALVEINSKKTVTLTLGESEPQTNRRSIALNSRQTGLLNRK